MSAEWPRVSIDAIKAPKPNALAMGPFGSRIKTENFVPQGVPVIRGVNLGKNRFYEREFVYITEEKADELSSANVFPGDIVFTHRGTLGQVTIIPYNSKYSRYVISQSQMKLTCNPAKADPLYVYYCFRSPEGQNALLANASTTGVPAIAKPLTTLKSLKIPLPPLSIQHAIAHILGTLDDKIELNERMNRTLEAIAQAIFKSWFVDFEPFRDGEFVESELGRTPKGWEVARFTDVMLVNPKRSLKKGSVAKHVDMKALPEKGARVREWSERAYKGSGARFQNGDVLLARITPCLENGKTAYADFLDEGEVGFGSTEFIVLRCPEGWPLEYMYFLARSEPFRSFAIQNMTGTSGRQRVPADCFKQFFIAVPPSDVLAKFGKLAKAVFALMKANDEEARTLAQIRDVLLSKLISGEIRVKDAEKFMEKAHA